MPKSNLTACDDEAAELHDDGVVEAQVAPQLGAVFQGRVLADHLVDGIADVAEQGEGDQGHGQHDHQRFEEPPDREGEHGVVSVCSGCGCGPQAAAGQHPLTCRANALLHPDLVEADLVVGALHAR